MDVVEQLLHILKNYRKYFRNIEPRHIPETPHDHAVSGIEPLIYDDSMRPLFVGERTNVIGSRKFKELIRDEKFEQAPKLPVRK